MKQRIIGALAFLLFFAIITVGIQWSTTSTPPQRVGVLIPAAYRGVTDLLKSFRERIYSSYGEELQIDAHIAYDDPLIKETIIQTFRDQKHDVIVTIGTAATAAAMSVIQEQIIVGVDVSSTFEAKHSNVITVKAIDSKEKVRFIKALKPGIKRIAVVHIDLPIWHEAVKDFVQEAAKENLELQPIVLQELAMLHTVQKRIPEGTEALMLLSGRHLGRGLPILAAQAEQLGIPVITGDEGTVAAGAAVGYGASQEGMGRAAADLVIHVLEGDSGVASLISPAELKVFVNIHACERQKVDIVDVERAARMLRVPVVRMDRES